MADIPAAQPLTIVYELVTLRLFGEEKDFRDRLRNLCLELVDGELVGVHVMNEMMTVILASEPRQQLILSVMADRLDTDPQRWSSDSDA